VRGEEDAEGAHRGLVDFTRRRGARTHALLPAVGLQELIEGGVRERGTPPGASLRFSPTGGGDKSSLPDNLTDALELSPVPVGEVDLAEVVPAARFDGWNGGGL
jgi:hypothetical protein